ncbi:hypothetical protein CJ202_05935 [Corynebacterium parakroppenstedtii]|nr:hypothetical protein HMPREF1861_00566 [Corynebacterium kroppenstedtii]PMC66423.1 hypothetical protein CJ202_05935 [Corynebacterium kroppenstedtii]
MHMGETLWKIRRLKRNQVAESSPQPRRNKRKCTYHPLKMQPTNERVGNGVYGYSNPLSCSMKVVRQRK